MWRNLMAEPDGGGPEGPRRQSGDVSACDGFKTKRASVIILCVATTLLQPDRVTLVRMQHP